MYKNFNATHILDSRFHGNDRMGARVCRSRLDPAFVARRLYFGGVGSGIQDFFVAVFCGLIGMEGKIKNAHAG